MRPGRVELAYHLAQVRFGESGYTPKTPPFFVLFWEIAMEICNDRRHNSIVHTDRYCPLCIALDRVGELEEQVTTLEDQVSDLEQV
jgi:hypothetical protein